MLKNFDCISRWNTQRVYRQVALLSPTLSELRSPGIPFSSSLLHILLHFALGYHQKITFLLKVAFCWQSHVPYIGCRVSIAHHILTESLLPYSLNTSRAVTSPIRSWKVLLQIAVLATNWEPEGNEKGTWLLFPSRSPPPYGFSPFTLLPQPEPSFRQAVHLLSLHFNTVLTKIALTNLTSSLVSTEIILPLIALRIPRAVPARYGPYNFPSQRASRSPIRADISSILPRPSKFPRPAIPSTPPSILSIKSNQIKSN